MNRNWCLAGWVAKVLVANSNGLHGSAIHNGLLHRPTRHDLLIRDTRPHLTGGIRIRSRRNGAAGGRLSRVVRRPAVLRLYLSPKPSLRQTEYPAGGLRAI